mmetsp:Transcript_26749/g.78805  ORF Transcript_26749/g.78805 Transcript_26749/m.78805 type:complete len:209 (+) Transcript_26749:99-725(+)
MMSQKRSYQMCPGVRGLSGRMQHQMPVYASARFMKARCSPGSSPSWNTSGLMSVTRRTLACVAEGTLSASRSAAGESCAGRLRLYWESSTARGVSRFSSKENSRRRFGSSGASMLKTWSRGHWMGRGMLDPGMRPWCGAHHRSKPHQSLGMINTRPVSSARMSPERMRASCQLTRSKWWATVLGSAPPGLRSSAGTCSSMARRPLGGS